MKMAGTIIARAPILNQVFTSALGCHLNGDSLNKVQNRNPRGVTRDCKQMNNS